METKANNTPATRDQVEKFLQSEEQAKSTEVSTEVKDHGESFVATWTRAALAVATSVPNDHPHKRALISQFLETADKPIGEYVGQTIQVVHFMAHEVQLPDMATGELVDKVRIVMKLADGTTTDCFSPSFMKGFRWLAVQLGDGPWDPPLQLKIKSHKAKIAGVYYTCSEAYDDVPKGVTISQKRKPT